MNSLSTSRRRMIDQLVKARRAAHVMCAASEPVK